MKVTAALVAFFAVAFAAPEVAKRQVNPASATASLLQVLPSSILNVALTNPAEASTLIQESFSTGTPDWFKSLPPAVQSYFIAQAGGTAPAATGATPTGSAAGAGPTGGSNSTSNSTVTTGSMPSGSASASGSGSSSGSGAFPTAVVGGGLAGLVGLAGMLIL